MLRFIVLDDGETYGQVDGANLVEIEISTPGLREALDSEKTGEWLFEHGKVTPLNDLIPNKG